MFGGSHLTQGEKRYLTDCSQSHLSGYFCLFTGRNEVLAKVIFLHVSFILFTGVGVSAPNFREGGCLLQIFGGGVCSKFSGGSAPNFRGGLLQIFGGRGWLSAPNFRGGDVCSKFSGGYVWSRGGFLQFSEYGHHSAGTHPTGMHSCLPQKFGQMAGTYE